MYVITDHIVLQIKRMRIVNALVNKDTNNHVYLQKKKRKKKLIYIYVAFVVTEYYWSSNKRKKNCISSV